jgi:hypothetical protein
MNLRLKSSSASRGVPPKPAAPSRKLGPMNASQRSPVIPIFGRKRAAGLRGWVCKKSSTSPFMISGSSSIFNAVTSKYRVQATFWIHKSRARSNQ